MTKKLARAMQWTLALLFTFSFVAFAACGGSSTSQSSTKQEHKAPFEMTISRSELVLTQFTQAYISVDCSYPVDVVWTSSDESVATVEGGVVTALKVGEATITATAEGISKTCVVSVLRSEDYPLLELNQYDAKIRVGEELSVSSQVKFRGEKTEDYTLTISSSNVAIVEASIDENNNVVLRAKATGSATVTVVAEYDGLKVARTIAVTIVNG